MSLRFLVRRRYLCGWNTKRRISALLIVGKVISCTMACSARQVVLITASKPTIADMISHCGTLTSCAQVLRLILVSFHRHFFLRTCARKKSVLLGRTRSLPCFCLKKKNCSRYSKDVSLRLSFSKQSRQAYKSPKKCLCKEKMEFIRKHINFF